MFELSSIALLFILSLWLFGALQRLVLLKRYNKDIDSVDYLHTGLTFGMLILPAIFFYRTGSLYPFLFGFCFAYITLTIGTMLGGLILLSHISRHPLGQPAIAIYSIIFYAPITLVMIMMGIYLRNPFILGAAFSITSSWIGYSVLLEK